MLSILVARSSLALKGVHDREDELPGEDLIKNDALIADGDVDDYYDNI